MWSADCIIGIAARPKLGLAVRVSLTIDASGLHTDPKMASLPPGRYHSHWFHSQITASQLQSCTLRMGPMTFSGGTPQPPSHVARPRLRHTAGETARFNRRGHPAQVRPISCANNSGNLSSVSISRPHMRGLSGHRAPKYTRIEFSVDTTELIEPAPVKRSLSGIQDAGRKKPARILTWFV